MSPIFPYGKSLFVKGFGPIPMLPPPPKYATGDDDDDDDIQFRHRCFKSPLNFIVLYTYYTI